MYDRTHQSDDAAFYQPFAAISWPGYLRGLSKRTPALILHVLLKIFSKNCSLQRKKDWGRGWEAHMVPDMPCWTGLGDVHVYLVRHGYHQQEARLTGDIVPQAETWGGRRTLPHSSSRL